MWKKNKPSAWQRYYNESYPIMTVKHWILLALVFLGLAALVLMCYRAYKHSKTLQHKITKQDGRTTEKNNRDSLYR